MTAAGVVAPQRVIGRSENFTAGARRDPLAWQLAPFNSPPPGRGPLAYAFRGEGVGGVRAESWMVEMRIEITRRRGRLRRRCPPDSVGGGGVGETFALAGGGVVAKLPRYAAATRPPNARAIPLLPPHGCAFAARALLSPVPFRRPHGRVFV